MKQSRKIIQSFALTQCTFNQPTAAIAAYSQFIRQTAVKNAPAGTAHLIIIDSSATPSQATAFYEQICQTDQRVTYLHIPVRPGYGDEAALAAAEENFPLAYRWRKGGPYNSIYLDAVPSDDAVRRMYIEQADVRAILASNGREAYAKILSLAVDGRTAYAKVLSHAGHHDAAKFMVSDQWVQAVNEVFNHANEIYPRLARPLLSSKRQIAIRIAEAKHCDMIAHLDDDWVGDQWIENHRQVLAGADITGLTHYPVFIQTTDMPEPVWGVANLQQGGSGYVIGFDGKPEASAKLTPVEMQGWSLAHRVNGALSADLVLPSFTPKYFGEDRLFLSRAREAGFEIKPQTDYDMNMAVRGVYGHSSSNNNVNEILGPGDSRLPSEENRAQVKHYYDKLRVDFKQAAASAVAVEAALPASTGQQLRVMAESRYRIGSQPL